MDPTVSPLLIHDDGDVRWIMMNRPEVHNAQNVAMLVALDRALDDLRWNRSVRVLVLGGLGKSFCSGHDLKEMSTNAEYREAASTAEGRYWQEKKLFVEPVRKFRELSIPTVCRIQGYCLAAGLMFAASADFVIASDDAVFGSPIISNLAVNEAEVASFSLRVGERHAKQLLWLSERIPSTEAMRIGLVNWVVANGDLDSKCHDLADRLTKVPREVLALSKESFGWLADRQGESDFNRYHFLSHQLSHHTTEAQFLLADRLERNAQTPSSRSDAVE